MESNHFKIITPSPSPPNIYKRRGSITPPPSPVPLRRQSYTKENIQIQDKTKIATRKAHLYQLILADCHIINTKYNQKKYMSLEDVQDYELCERTFSDMLWQVIDSWDDWEVSLNNRIYSKDRDSILRNI